MTKRMRGLALGAAILAGLPAAAEPVTWIQSTSRSARAGTVRVAPSSGWIGVWLVDEVDGGARIVALVPGGPAELAQLQIGDIIVQANAKAVPEQDTLSVVLQTLSPGAPLELQVIRAGDTLARSVLVAARPTRPLVSFSVVRPSRRGLDLEVTEITPALREHYGAPGDAGVLVVRVDPQGLGGRSGIVVGDVLVRIADQPIVNPRQVQWLFWQPSEDSPIDAVIVRKGKSKTLRLATLETEGREAQDGQALRRAESDALSNRLRLELERIERRMVEIRRELKQLEREK